MKTLFNKIMMAMVAVVMVIGFSAFKAVNNKKLDTFVFVLKEGGNPLNHEDYEYSPFGTDCTVGFEICAVSNDDDNMLTEEELDRIINQQEGSIYWKL